MISIIICSKSPELLKKVSNSIENTIGIEYEIVVISNPDGQFGICEAYNRGAEIAKYSSLCFCHEDVIFHTSNWGQLVVNHLQDEATGIIGVVGCMIKPNAPSAPWIGGFPVNSVYMLQGVLNGEPYLKHVNPDNDLKSEVVVIDGLWMCCRKEVWEKNRFDQTTLKGFHGYDVDFSLQISQNYRNFVIFDILLEHLSNGGNTKTWLDATYKVHEKWNATFKILKHNITEPCERKIIANQWAIFLYTMIHLKYPRFVVIKFWILSGLIKLNIKSGLKIFAKNLFRVELKKI